MLSQFLKLNTFPKKRKVQCTLKTVNNFIKLFIANGADINIIDKDNRTPLDTANSFGLKEISRVLIKHCAKTNRKDSWCLFQMK